MPDPELSTKISSIKGCALECSVLVVYYKSHYIIVKLLNPMNLICNVIVVTNIPHCRHDLDHPVCPD